MTRPVVFHVPTHGNWSGGGKGVLNNYRHAASRHAEISFEHGDIDIVNRNYPNTGWRRPFILAPQNAWPWEGPRLGAREIVKVNALRIASEAAMRRAKGVIRVGGSIPRRNHTHPDLLPNPLDPDFDEQARAIEVTASPSAAPYLLSLGSINSYRGLEELLEGYRAYLGMGGELPLRIVGAGQAHYLDRIRRLSHDLPMVSVSPEGVSRREALRLLHHARAAVLPSHVEASPFSLLEALAVQHTVVASDITGHRDIVPTGVPEPAWFSHADPVGLATQLLHAKPTTGLPQTPLSVPDRREELRVNWGDQLARILRDLSDGATVAA